MIAKNLSDLLEHEHRDIDGAIEEYASGLAKGKTDPGPLTRAVNGLRRHIYLEETFLFPPLKTAGLTMPIFVMVREHGELWDAMDTLDGLLESDTGAESLQNACREILSKLNSHNAKEEPVIYPQADAKLDPDAASRLHAFLENGSMPDGWRCEKANSVTA